MPCGEAIEFAVLVDGTKLPEYRIKDSVYTEVDLHGPSSYHIEEEGQKYPVIPFKIVLRRLTCYPLWISVYLDGQVICARPLSGRQLEISGVKVGIEIHELLFSLPRITESQTKASALGDFAGTIRVVCTVAEEAGEKLLPVWEPVPASVSYNQQTRLQHMSKKDVSGKQSSAGVIVSREGRTTLQLTNTQRFRRAVRYVPSSEVIEEVVLNYRPRICTTEIPTGLSTTNPATAPDKGDPGHTPLKPLVTDKMKSSPRTPLGDVSNRGKGSVTNDTFKTEVVTSTPISSVLPAENIKQEMRAMSPVLEEAEEEPLPPIIRPKDIKKRASEMFDMIRIKQENLEEDADDDCFIIIDDYGFEDDSVVYMGDDDCQILDISNNISVIDLGDTLSLNADEEELLLE